MDGDVQVGLASQIFGGCAAGYPDMFTRLSSYGSFIKQALGDDADDLQFED